MSAAQVSRMETDRVPPYDPYLLPRMEPILKTCKEKGIKIITNQGWLDPEEAAQQVAADLGAQSEEPLTAGSSIESAAVTVQPDVDVVLVLGG